MSFFKSLCTKFVLDDVKFMRKVISYILRKRRERRIEWIVCGRKSNTQEEDKIIHIGKTGSAKVVGVDAPVQY